MRKILLAGSLVFIVVAVALRIGGDSGQNPPAAPFEDRGGPQDLLHPLAIEALRQREYPGSQIEIEQTLSAGQNYQRYIASYKSDGLKIFGLLTVPQGQKPEGGFPAIIFNHGFIPPEQYVTTQRYEDYVDALAKAGYVVFKPDYRGHGNSEGKPEGGYFSPGYTVDILNALSSIKKHPDVNPEKIGMWGHSMGGFLTLRSMVISRDVKAGVIWAGSVGSYEDFLENWPASQRWRSMREHREQRPERESFIQKFGTPSQNPEFWDSISPTAFLSQISGPVQLHHAVEDQHVPFEFSKKLKDLLEKEGKEVELYSYPGSDHNLRSDFNAVMGKTVEFFNTYLK